jgi:hypothetical protein
MYGLKKDKLIEWLRLLIDEMCIIDIVAIMYIFNGIKFMLVDVLNLTELSKRLNEFEEFLRINDANKLNQIVDDIDQNWNFYIDQVMNKLIEEK